MERFSFHKSTSQALWGLSFLIQFYKTVVSEYLILFVVNMETNTSLNPRWKKMEKHLSTVNGFITYDKSLLKKNKITQWVSKPAGI